MCKALIVGTEEAGTVAVMAALARRGFSTTRCGSAAPDSWPESGNYGLIVVVLDDADEKYCGALGADTEVPTLVVSRNSSSDDRVQALNAGADDFVPPSSDLDEVAARAVALVRRNDLTYDALVRFGRMTLRPRARQVFIDEEPVGLTPREFDLLAYLAACSGRIISRAELAEHVWGNAEVQSNVVEVHMRRLRSKLKAHRDCVETVRGAGYRLRRQSPLSAPSTTFGENAVA